MRKPTLLLLGTFHMRYTSDLFLPEFDEELLPEREEEIKVFVERINDYNPSKIALEIETKHHEKVNEEYAAFIRGELNLQMDEAHQIGFRLAQIQGHQLVYPVDWMESVGQISMGEVVEYARENHHEIFQQLSTKTFLQNLKQRSILDIFQECNDESMFQQTKEMYMSVARIGKIDNYVGIDWLRWWYQRNLIIFSNLVRLIDSQKDRIFLLIGAAHVPFIKTFAEESGIFHIESIKDYLFSDKQVGLT